MNQANTAQSARSNKPVFMLGIGCQKAGTSWLHHYLKDHPAVGLPSPKELHVLDAMLRPDLFREFHARALREQEAKGLRARVARKLRWRHRRRGRPRNHATPAMRARMIERPEAYTRFFEELAQDAPVVGEITPSYAALSADDLAFVRKLLEPRFDLRVIVLLRDPVERAWSAVRHFRRINDGRFDAALRGGDNALFERLFDTPYIWERADYPTILANLDRAFEPTQVHVGFYEELFTPQAVDAICGFLGIEKRPADFERVANPSRSATRLDPAMAHRARAVYAPIYEGCARRFGDERLASLWPNYAMGAASR